eukprot:gene6832-16615_t
MYQSPSEISYPICRAGEGYPIKVPIWCRLKASLNDLGATPQQIGADKRGTALMPPT